MTGVIDWTQSAIKTIDAIVIIVSVTIVVIVGMVAGRGRGKSAGGYFVGGHKMPWWLIGPAFVATGISSEQMVGTIGVTYAYGMGIANWEWFALPIYTITLVFFIPLFLSNKITTVPEYFNRRFGPLCGDIYSWVLLFAYVFIYMVTILYSGSLAFSSLTGWNFYVILWFTALLVGLYTIKGGLHAVMWTDFIQCILLLTGGTVMFFVALHHIPGGWHALEAASPARMHLYQPVNHEMAPFLGLVFATVGMCLFYQVGNQAMFQRILGARSIYDGILGLLFASFINLLRPMVTCFLGLVVYHWIYVMNMAPPLENKDLAFPFALRTFAPEWGLRGVILSGFIAAIMGATSGLVNSTATLFAYDVYGKLINKKATDAQLVKVGRVCAGLALIISASLAPIVAHLGGIFQFFQTAMTYVACPFMATFLMGLFWKRTNYTGAIFGLIGGLVIQMTVAFGLPALGIKLHFFYYGFIAQMIDMIGIGIVSALTAPPRPEQLGSNLWRPAMLGLASAPAGQPRPWFKRLTLWYGIYAVIWFILYYTFW